LRNIRLVIGSRGSQLALWQANWVKDQLASAGYDVGIRVIKTTGDKLQHLPSGQSPAGSIAQVVAEAGTKGLFIKEIEEALIAGEIDIAVHSLKDLPTEQPAGLSVAAVPPREDARDVFISRSGKPLKELLPGSRVGTSSLRRQTQLHSLRSDLAVVPLRGNLDTRLRKLERGECEALVVAAAGVHRLGLRQRITAYFDFDEMCPAVGQGALAIEIRQGDSEAAHGICALDHTPTHLAVRAERAVLRRLGGGCQVPIAAHAFVEDGHLRLWGVVASLDGKKLVRATATETMEDPERLGATVAEELFRQGAKQILASIPKP
jgi:hydroxymethylbilane synthase